MEQEAGGADHSLAQELTELAQELTEKLTEELTRQFGGASPQHLTISKVREPTRNVNPAEYDPQHVSVGPYHWTSSNQSLNRCGEKLRSLDAVMSAGTARPVHDYIKELALVESDARSCYAHTFDDMTGKDFVRMLLLDGCYILDSLGVVTLGATGDGSPQSPPTATANATSSTPNGHTEGEHSGVALPSIGAHGSSNKLVDPAAARDVLYLFENQIPLFVINKIYEVMASGNHLSAEVMIAEYVHKIMQDREYSVAKPVMKSPGNLLHMMHMHLRPTDGNNDQSLKPGDSSSGGMVRRWRTATDYYTAGVKFKKRELGINEARCILDVKLDGGMLWIPLLNVESETLCILRNLMALEQHNLAALGSRVTAYCVFLSQVACTAKDVALLSKKKILVHHMGNNDELAKHLGNLCKGVVFDPNDSNYNYLRSTCQALEQHFHSRLWNWMASLRHDYFSNPWVATAVVAALVQLTCAVLQAAYAVLSYKHENTPNSPG